MFLRKAKPPSPLRQVSLFSEVDLEARANEMLEKSRRALQNKNNPGTLEARKIFIISAKARLNAISSKEKITESDKKFVLLKYKEKLIYLCIENHAKDFFSRSKDTILKHIDNKINVNTNDFVSIIAKRLEYLYKNKKIAAGEKNIIFHRYIELLNEFCDEKNITKPTDIPDQTPLAKPMRETGLKYSAPTGLTLYKEAIHNQASHRLPSSEGSNIQMRALSSTMHTAIWSLPSSSASEPSQPSFSIEPGL